jgi:hypothetical protein
MEINLPFHIKLYNDRVRQMNQTNSKILTLNQQEAQSLHAEIYDLMATIATLSHVRENPSAVVEVSMDGGVFK